jgi:hypothetical protein
MLSVLVASRCDRLLVVVPTDPLRTQIAGKFSSLGILRQCKVVDDNAANPIVGILRKRPKTIADVTELFGKCNVVVTTMAAIAGCSDELQAAMASLCSHLFIDEAHHIGAPTWEAFKKAFEKAQVLQFTATPFRMDEKPVGERILFLYSLRQAQEDGYFQPIEFKPVREFDPRQRDRAIADAAVEQLERDFDKGHILMARVADIPRAKEVFTIYEAHQKYAPVQIHTGIKSPGERNRIRERLISGRSRIVVCVDMLGEGFDLPELKIAAFHDIRQSLPVTLQLVGRFTRGKEGLGHATVVANVADVSVRDELRKLYRRGVDWNSLLPHFSDRAIQSEIELGDFIAGFQKFPDTMTPRDVRPAMSMVAYRTDCSDWTPEDFADGIPGYDSLDRVYHSINASENTLIIMTARRVPLDWAQIDDIYTWDWQLYILYWNRESKLLFIHNSGNKGFFYPLASSVATNAKLISGPDVFKCLATATRLRLQNVGLIETLGRLIRFTMRAGSDVESGLSMAQRTKAIKSNLFGSGFEGGHRTTIGCSYKGRIWSRQKTNVREFTRWCDFIGQRLLDPHLDPEQVLNGTLRPERVAGRPSLMPIAAEWPESFYNSPETAIHATIGDDGFYLHEMDLEIEKPDQTGPLRVAIVTQNYRVIFELAFKGRGNDLDFEFKKLSSIDASIRHESQEEPISSLFTEDPPTIWFADGSSLRGNEHVSLRQIPPPFAKDRIVAWDWQGVNIRKESQGRNRDATSIQYHVIQQIKTSKPVIVFDDDGSGEAADVVAIRETEELIEVEFWHCKYSHESTAGARVGDLYELCGQAQRSVRWMEHQTELFQHLMRRERADGNSRFEVGTEDDLERIIEKSRLCAMTIKIFIVQPGLSKDCVSDEQLTLLGVTENFLTDTYRVSLCVVSST